MRTSQRRASLLTALSLGWLAGVPACSESDVRERVCGDAEADPARAARASSIPGVVAVLSGAPDGEAAALCTATVVGPRTVLTAKHCVDGKSDWIVEVFFDADATRTGRRVRIASMALHPRLDLAVLTLPEDAGVEPIPWADLGTQFEFRTRTGYSTIGYGAPEGDPERCLRTEHAVVLGDFGSAKVVGGVCRGDSGGPLLVPLRGATRVVGVASAGVISTPSSSCSDGAVFSPLWRDDPWTTAELGPEAT